MPLKNLLMCTKLFLVRIINYLIKYIFTCTKFTDVVMVQISVAVPPSKEKQNNYYISAH